MIREHNPSLAEAVSPVNVAMERTTNEGPLEPAHSLLTTVEGRTDLANARRLAAKHGQDFHWCEAEGQFRVWNGRCWILDECLTVPRLAKSIAEKLFAEAEELDDDPALDRFLRATASSTGIRSMLQMVKSEPGIALPPTAFDRYRHLLNLSNGLLDLETGGFGWHDREKYLTAAAPVEFDSDAQCPTWLHFIEAVFEGNEELMGFVQRAAGYCLSGDVSEQVLFLCVGEGANGKSTFLNVLMAVLGVDFAMKASKDLLLSTGGSTHPTELTDLRGKRLVACIETERNRRLSEGLVKELTGSDNVRARRMRENFREFSPTHKIWLATNHKPTIYGTDEGIWRRIQLIPFKHRFTAKQQDKRLFDRLLQELSGILNWLLEGYRDWREKGSLEPPSSVLEATQNYRAEMDRIGQFINDCCLVGAGGKCKAAVLYQAYCQWCEEEGETPESQKTFGSQLTKRGHERFQSNGTHYRGLRLQGRRARVENGTMEGCGTFLDVPQKVGADETASAGTNSATDEESRRERIRSMMRPARF